MLRPISVSIIGSVLLVGYILDLIRLALSWNDLAVLQMMQTSLISYEAYVTMCFLGNVAGILFSVAILSGYNWGRIGLMIVNLFAIVGGLIFSPIKTVVFINVIIAVVCGFFLFREEADDFFGKSYFSA